MEFVLKVIAFGLFSGEHAYVKNAWNKLDGFLVTVSGMQLRALADVYLTCVGTDSD